MNRALIYWNYASFKHKKKELAKENVNSHSQVSNECDEERKNPIVVIFAWMFSSKKNLSPYINLYNSFGYDVLTCHPPVLNLWLPDRAHSLAVEVLDTLLNNLSCDRPLIFSSFSGGVKACHYKLLQILMTEVSSNKKMNCYDKINRNVCGQIFDSCPIDFLSQIGVKFLSVPSDSRTRQVSPFRASLVSSAAWLLDFFFLDNFEKQRNEFWKILNESAKFGPMLFLFSKNDELAPFECIVKFSNHLISNGFIVHKICWDESQHVAHLKRHKEEYVNEIEYFLSLLMKSYACKTINILSRL